MYPIHADIILTPAQQRAVLDYVRAVDFHLPGAAATDFTAVVPRARYAGWDFMSEDLDSYVVGLVCTKPGFEKKHTFIRVSYDQLTGKADPKLLPVNDPVLAADTFRMKRWRDDDFVPGLDCFAADAGVARDLRILSDTLGDIRAYRDGGGTKEDRAQFDFSVDWGVLMAGRYPRLVALRKAGKLSADEDAALGAFEDAVRAAHDDLVALDLPTLETLQTPERRPHSAHHS